MANRTCNVCSDFVGYLSFCDMPPCLLCIYTRHGTLAVSDSRRVWKCRILQNTMSVRGQHLYCATDRRFLYAWNLASNRKQQFGSYRSHRSRHTFCIYTIAGIYADKSRKKQRCPCLLQKQKRRGKRRKRKGQPENHFAPRPFCRTDDLYFRHHGQCGHRIPRKRNGEYWSVAENTSRTQRSYGRFLV